MKEINLSENKKALIDDDDYDLISQFKWFSSKNRNVFYAEKTDFIGSKKIKTKMHRLILNITNKKNQIDHIDGNGLNNQKSNLRICSISQNGCNRRVSKNKKSSKYLGVFNNKGRWMASCRHNGVLHSKSAISEIDAAIKYNELAKYYHNEFARLNKVCEVFIEV